MSLNNTLTSTGAVDVFAILDSAGNQVIENGRPLQASIIRSSKKFTHPLENNATRADGKIITPVQISVSIIFQGGDYESGYRELERLFERSDSLMVRTKVRTFDNMIITDMPHKEDSAAYDAITVDIKLEETLLATVVILPANNPAFSTVNRGQQQTQAANADQTSGGSFLFRQFFGS